MKVDSLHMVICGCSGLCVNPCGPMISMWTQFDDDDVSMTMTKPMTMTVTFYVVLV
jgi:hypothetical protein